MSVIELFNSRMGSLGANGATRTRRFRVTLSDSAEVQDPLQDEGLPSIGSGFYQFPGMVVKSYSLSSRMSLREFVVDTTYSAPNDLIPPWGSLWQVSVSASVKSVRQDVTTQSEEDRANRLLPTVVGPNIYIEDSEGAYQAKTKVVTLGQVVPDIVSLRQLDVRKREGMDVSVPVATLTLKRRYTHPIINYGQALGKLTMVNDDVFFGAAPGQLQFTALNMAPVQISTLENPSGIGYDAFLGFLWNPNGHQHQITHMYESAEGSVSVVEEKSGDAVVERFSRYLVTSFNAMVSSLGGKITRT